MLNCADMKQRFFHAIKNGEFCVWYQPQVDMRSGTPRGAEALVRWKRADGGFVRPAGFVAELERLGLMERLDEEVLQIVCRDIREGKKRGFSPGTVSVNLSRLHAEKAGTADRLKEMVERHGVSRREVSFEITETVPEEAVSSATDSGVAGGLDLPQDDTYGDGSVVKPAEPADVYKDENYGNSYYWYGDDVIASGFNASIDPETGLIVSLNIENEG